MVNQPDNFDPLYTAQSPIIGDGFKKIADELDKKYKGKILELYIGDQSESQSFDGFDVPQNCIIYGKLEEIFDRFLLINCFYVDGTGKISDGNMCFINFFQIRAMTELNKKGSLHDIFLSSKSSSKIYKFLKQTSK